MKLVLVFGQAMCYCREFVINGVKATSDDFGVSSDHDIENAPEDGGCGERRFEKNGSTPDVLNKYQITDAEYDDICEKLEAGLSFGNCSLCR